MEYCDLMKKCRRRIISWKLSDYRKHRYGLADEPKKTTQENFYKQKASSQSNHGLKSNSST